MSVKQTDFGVLGIELEIAPDDEYEYLLCKNRTDNSHLCLRRNGDTINIWKLEAFNWHDEDFSFREMKNKDQLDITIVTSKLRVVLPSSKQAYAEASKRSN